MKKKNSPSLLSIPPLSKFETNTRIIDFLIAYIQKQNIREVFVSVFAATI